MSLKLTSSNRAKELSLSLDLSGKVADTGSNSTTTSPLMNEHSPLSCKGRARQEERMWPEQPNSEDEHLVVPKVLQLPICQQASEQRRDGDLESLFLIEDAIKRFLNEQGITQESAKSVRQDRITKMLGRRRAPVTLSSMD